MFTHFDRSVFLTGVLSPPVAVNSSGLLNTITYGVQMSETINADNLYIQGGPGKSVATFEHKIISGDISFFLRYNESNTLEQSVIDLINSAQDYKSKVTLTTFLLPYNVDITPESPAYIAETNSFVFDICVVEELRVKAQKSGSIECNVKIIGQTDLPNTTPLVLPSDSTDLYRNISWYDCDFTRNGSRIENAEEIEIIVKKQIEQPYFLMTYGEADRYDRPHSTGVKSITVEFTITEHLTSAYDIFSYSFGGFDDGFNFEGNIGPLNFLIPNAILDISTESLEPNLIKRKTKGIYRLAPNTPEDASFVFTI